MLQDYINEYIEAKRNNDEKLMQKIQHDLAQVGMDKYTLEILVATEMKHGSDK